MQTNEKVTGDTTGIMGDVRPSDFVGKNFAEMTDDQRNYVSKNRDEFSHLAAEVKEFFADFWTANAKREEENAERYPDEEE